MKPTLSYFLGNLMDAVAEAGAKGQFVTVTEGVSPNSTGLEFHVTIHPVGHKPEEARYCDILEECQAAWRAAADKMKP